MNIAARLVAACLLALTLGAFAQTPPPLVETMEVRVVNLDVVVTDKKGNRITGLTQNDFDVLDKRRPQLITNFSEIHEDASTVAMHQSLDATPDATAAATPQRRRNTIVFFIDSTSIDPMRRHVVFNELRRFAANAMLPGDRAMIAVWNRSFHIAVPFTESPEEIQLVLSNVEQVPGGLTMKQNRRSIEEHIVDTLRAEQESPNGSIGRAYQEARASAFSYTEETRAQLRMLLDSVSSTMTVFGGSEDKKAFVFVGEYLPDKAGASMFSFVEELFAPFNLPNRAGNAQFDAISMADELQKAVVSANASGVTLYMIASGDLAQLGADVENQEADTSPLSRDIDRQETLLAFSSVAEQTGGLAFLGGKNPRNVLQQIVDDFHIYYSIGFRPTGPENKQRSIRVRAKNPDYIVRTRNNYALRSVADEMADRVVANFHQAGSVGELRVSVDRGLAQVSGRAMHLPVKVHVQGDRITLIPRGDVLEGEVTVFVCAGDLESDASKVQRHTQRLRVPASDEPRFRAGYLTFDFEVVLRQKGEKVLSAGVLDTISGSYGTARKNVIED